MTPRSAVPIYTHHKFSLERLPYSGFLRFHVPCVHRVYSDASMNNVY